MSRGKKGSGSQSNMLSANLLQRSKQIKKHPVTEKKGYRKINGYRKKRSQKISYGLISRLVMRRCVPGNNNANKISN